MLTILLWQGAVIGHLNDHPSLLPKIALAKVNAAGPEADVCAGQLHSDASLHRKDLPHDIHLQCARL